MKEIKVLLEFLAKIKISLSLHKFDRIYYLINIRFSSKIYKEKKNTMALMNFKKAKENSKAAKNSKISFKKYQKENTNHI